MLICLLNVEVIYSLSVGETRKTVYSQGIHRTNSLLTVVDHPRIL